MYCPNAALMVMVLGLWGQLPVCVSAAGAPSTWGIGCVCPLVRVFATLGVSGWRVMLRYDHFEVKKNPEINRKKCLCIDRYRQI